MPTPDPQQSQKIEHSSIQGSKIQQGQAEYLTQIQADTLTQSYFSLLGGDRRTKADKLRSDLAEQLLTHYVQPELEQRLQNTIWQNVWLNPELEEQPRQVGGLIPNRIVQVSGKPSETLDLQTTILEVFARPGIRKKLLILGEPGVGKTTTLLTLADQLVQQALINLGTAIPVIFELSTWEDDKQSIEEWLVNQLKKIDSRLTSEITRRWLQEKLLVPLLDGLDELGERQSTCVRRLNEFAAQYPYLVVCCRAEEYAAAEVLLNHRRGAVRLQPLTSGQVQNYLQQVEQLQPLGQPKLWNAIETQPAMQALLHPDSNGRPGILQIPLFLKIAAETYEGKSFGNKTELLEAYINRRLNLDVKVWERGNFKHQKRWAYTTVKQEPDWRKTYHYLSWLSQRLEYRNQVEFLIGTMQPSPSWLATEKQAIAHMCISGLVNVMILGFGLTIAFVAIERSEPIFNPLFSFDDSSYDLLSNRLIYGITLLGMGCYSLILTNFPITPSTKCLFSLAALKEFLNKVLLWALGGGLLFGILGVIVGSLYGAIAGGLYENLVKGLLLGIFIGATFVILGWMLGWLFKEISSDMMSELFISSTASKISNASLKTNRNANQGIVNAGVNALMTVVVTTTLFGLWEIVYGELTGKPFFGFLIGFSLGIFFGLFPGGGATCINHCALRLILSSSGCIPWNYAQFLDYCVERRLLQRIGDRYRFLHRELSEHFAHQAGDGL